MRTSTIPPKRARAPLGVGLCGLGRHGMRFARHLLAGDVPGARLAAVCRRDEDAGRAFAREHGLRYHARPDELAADAAVDLVCLVLPPDLHEAAAVAALDRGKPVFVDKPMAASVTGGRRILEAAERAGLPVMVGYSLRYSPVIREMRRRVADLGPLRAVAVCQRFEPTDRPWMDVPGRGGLVLNTGVHGIDLVRWLAGGEFAEVFALGRSVVTSRTEDSFAAVGHLDREPVLVTLDNCRATGGRLGRVEIVGERGQLVGDHVLHTLAAVEGRQGRAIDPGPPVATVREALADFTACVRSGRPAPVPAEEGLAGLRVVEALLRSIATGAPCRVG